jgi:DNA topoisomerase I
MKVIHREGTKKEYRYLDEKGATITDPEMLDYIQKLVIPPNYTDVKIFYMKNGQPKILFQGYDNKDRLQRVYSEIWKTDAAKKKFCGLLHFSEQLKNIKNAVGQLIQEEGMSKEKCIAMIIRLVMVCYFRIGNKKYQELYGSFGAMNILKKHIKFKSDDMGEHVHISFKGKKGVLNTCSVYDKRLISEIKRISVNIDNDDMVFRWDDRGNLTPVKAIEVNKWLNSFHPNITSKDFRTYDSNIFLIIYLKSKRDPEKLGITQRKKIIVRAMEDISQKLHNTPNVLKKNYTQSGIISMYINEPVRYNRYFRNGKDPAVMFSDYLKDYCNST